jgi:hypothetical protein
MTVGSVKIVDGLCSFSKVIVWRKYLIMWLETGANVDLENAPSVEINSQNAVVFFGPFRSKGRTTI